MLFSRFAQSAAALLLLIIGFTAPAHAQSNKQIISGTFYEDRAASTSSATSFILTFAQTPSNQFLNITNVSCQVEVSSATTVIAMGVYAGTISGANDLGRQYSILGNVTPQTIGGFKFYSIVTNQIYYKFGPGRFPTIEIDTLSTGSYDAGAQCVIVGNLTDN
jgi:hypothetical protein